ncbi:AAA family ATPase [Saccharopolyspora sp. CA-218241]|uniref:AAA family ATPase n=1 Tax=Saccharopolyspora sp. CA-218241 TaxID=3240027 RepID=UPI003D99C806
MSRPLKAPRRPGILAVVVNSKHPLPSSPARPERGVTPHPRGRAEVIARVLDACRSDTPVVAVTGPGGIGRSLVLARVRAELTASGVTTAEVPVVRDEPDAAHLVSRIGDELGLPGVRGPGGAGRSLTALAARREPVVVLLDDAHRIVPEALAALAGPVAALAGSQVTFVCSFRTPSEEHGAAAAALRARGLLHEERLRPLGTADVERMLTDLLRALPAPGTAAALREQSRGLPAVMRAAVDGYARTGCLRVVDHHAHLVEQRIPRMPLTHPLFAAFGGPDSPSWSVVKALALLGPLRGDVPGLIAESTGLPRSGCTRRWRSCGRAACCCPGRTASGCRCWRPCSPPAWARTSGPAPRSSPCARCGPAPRPTRTATGSGSGWPTRAGWWTATARRPSCWRAAPRSPPGAPTSPTGGCGRPPS